VKRVRRSSSSSSLVGVVGVRGRADRLGLDAWGVDLERELDLTASSSTSSTVTRLVQENARGSRTSARRSTCAPA
jgi:hypothetical protein